MKKNKNSPIVIFHDYRSLPAPLKLIKKTVEKIVEKEKSFVCTPVSVILCSNYKIRKLNAQYRNIDRPTDVLSFYFGDDDLLGEIYISLQKAAVQARKYGLTYNNEIKRLLIHGIFHLLGYDHNTANKEKVMQAKEQEYF